MPHTVSLFLYKKILRERKKEKYPGLDRYGTGEIFLGYSLTWAGEWYIFECNSTDGRSVGLYLLSVAKIVGAVDISTEGVCT